MTRRILPALLFAALLVAASIPARAQSNASVFTGSWWISIDKKTVWPQMIWRLDTVKLRANISDTARARALAVGDSLLALRGWTRLFVEGRIADSLRTIPRGLRTPGPLGYAWKTGPGGVQGWYPDSAGGGTAGLADTAANIRAAIGDTAAGLRAQLSGMILPTDSLRRLAASPIPIYGYGNFAAVTDTSNIRVFGNDNDGAMYSTENLSRFIAGHVNETVVLRWISITHSNDTSTTWRRRDTLIALAPDSITAGSRVWFAYFPASDVSLNNGTGQQVVRVYHVARNASSGAYADGKHMVPFILGNLMSQRGMRADHHLRVTLWVEKKIPGRVY